MSGSLDRFERVVRSIAAESSKGHPDPVESVEQGEPHPFDARNLHPELPNRVRKLFDDGHWEQSVFEAFKFIEKEVKRISGLRGKTGFALMMDAFNENHAKVQLTPLLTDSDIDEQRGYKSMFAGAAAGIRNPRGHEVASATPQMRPWTT